ncbi:MAG: hypothetical protein WC683_02960 [bacterium]
MSSRSHRARRRRRRARKYMERNRARLRAAVAASIAYSKRPLDALQRAHLDAVMRRNRTDMMWMFPLFSRDVQ